MSRCERKSAVKVSTNLIERKSTINDSSMAKIVEPLEAKQVYRQKNVKYKTRHNKTKTATSQLQNMLWKMLEAGQNEGQTN